jgi:hypothetical protein
MIVYETFVYSPYSPYLKETIEGLKKINGGAFPYRVEKHFPPENAEGWATLYIPEELARKIPDQIGDFEGLD